MPKARSRVTRGQIRAVMAVLEKTAKRCRALAPGLGVEEMVRHFSAEITHGVIEADPTQRLGGPYLEVLMRSLNDFAVSCYGGAKLNREELYGFYRHAAPLFVKHQIGVVTGGGPGLAMCDFPRMIRELRTGRLPHLYAVPSGLDDEPYMGTGDPRYTVHAMAHNEVREKIIAALGECGLVAPGYFGSVGEAYENVFDNYVSRRLVQFLMQPKPLFLLDLPGKEFKGGTFWQPIVDLEFNGCAAGCGKDVDICAYIIDISQPKQAAELLVELLVVFRKTGTVPNGQRWRKDGAFWRTI